MRDHGERLAVLEERTENQDEQIDTLITALHDLTQQVTDLNGKLDRKISFIGGIAFAFSIIGAGIGAFGSEIIRKLAGH